MSKYDKIKSGIMLGVIGDVIGFGNGKIEFNDNNIFSFDNYGEQYKQMGADYTNTIIFDFIYNGGIADHPKPHWTVSDDTIMLFANMKGLLTDFNNNNELIENTKIEYINIIKEKKDLDAFERIYAGGLTTISSLKKLKSGIDYKDFVYDEKAGGSGGSMRSMIYGAIFYDEKDKIKLLESCIETTCLTHNNAIAYLGAYACALFTALAMRNIESNKWCFELVEILETDFIDNYIKTNKEKDYAFYERDKKIFLNKWKDYIEDNFDDYDYKYKKKISMKYPSQRTLYYSKFSIRKNNIYPGAGGDDSVIIAYDCLLESEGNWEKLVYYSMLHVGDSDTTGIIAAFIYGIYYTSYKVNNKMIENLIDYKEEIYKYTELIYKKFFL